MKICILKNIRLKKTVNLFLFIFAALSLLSCTVKYSKRTTPVTPPSDITYREKGIASWYGKKFHGRLTANGEVYNMYGISAAHKTLPLGTVCKVTNIKNGESIVLRINDRGPFVKGRIIDLSYGAAKKLGFADEGLTEVIIEADIKKKALENSYSIQVGSFVERGNAEKLKNSLSQNHGNIYIEKYENGGEAYYRVKIGNYKSQSDAQKTLDTLNNSGISGFIVSNK